MTELSCPKARSMVSDYIDGDLPDDLATALEEHLQTCPFCPPLYASVVETLAELKALDDVAGVEGLVRRVVQAIDAEGRSRYDGERITKASRPLTPSADARRTLLGPTPFTAGSGNQKERTP